MYCCVLNFETGKIEIFTFDKTEEIEEILNIRYGSTNNLQWMCTEDLNIDVTTNGQD